jgi:hypothetical protein
MRWRTFFSIIGGTAAFVVIAAGAFVFLTGQRPDYSWQPSLTAARYQANAPRVLIDEAHHNASTAGFFGRYSPFAILLRADGYEVQRGRAHLTASALSAIDVLVIANASGAPRAQFWGYNLPLAETGDRGAAAFSEAEIATIREWVSAGGSLLLIADHAPFGAASSDLATAFGVRMHGGFVEVPDEPSDPLMFSRENGRLGEHEILTSVDRIMTFTGQSLSGPEGAAPLLILPQTAIEFVSIGGDAFESQPAGPLQGLALNHGDGRVVVLGEAAMLTAQVSAGSDFGMNIPGNDNQMFALNVMHWLSER